MSHLRSLPMHTTMAHLTMSGCHLHHLAVQYSSTSKLTVAAPRLSIPLTAGTSAPHPNTITHCIFVKATHAHGLSDTIYFKHKYKTTYDYPTDAIVNAFNDLMTTFKRMNILKVQQSMNTLEKLQDAFSPTTTPTQTPPPPQTHSPRMNFQGNVQCHTFDPNS